MSQAGWRLATEWRKNKMFFSTHLSFFSFFISRSNIIRDFQHFFSALCSTSFLLRHIMILNYNPSASVSFSWSSYSKLNPSLSSASRLFPIKKLKCLMSLSEEKKFPSFDELWKLIFRSLGFVLVAMRRKISSRLSFVVLFLIHFLCPSASFHLHRWVRQAKSRATSNWFLWHLILKHSEHLCCLLSN